MIGLLLYIRSVMAFRQHLIRVLRVDEYKNASCPLLFRLRGYRAFNIRALAKGNSFTSEKWIKLITKRNSFVYGEKIVSWILDKNTFLLG